VQLLRTSCGDLSWALLSIANRCLICLVVEQGFAPKVTARSLQVHHRSLRAGGLWIDAPLPPDLRRPTSGLTIEMWLNTSLLPQDPAAALFDCRKSPTGAGVALLRGDSANGAGVTMVLDSAHLIQASSDPGSLSSSVALRHNLTVRPREACVCLCLLNVCGTGFYARLKLRSLDVRCCWAVASRGDC
jgi:hypothetical protein